MSPAGDEVADDKAKTIVERIGAAWRTRYEEDLGCFTGMLYLGGLVVGLFVSVQLCQVATITLMHFPGGYFVDGLRYADSHGEVLTNGEAVPGALRVLTIPLYFLLMLGWMFGSLFVITGVARCLSRRPKAREGDKRGRCPGGRGGADAGGGGRARS